MLMRLKNYSQGEKLPRSRRKIRLIPVLFLAAAVLFVVNCAKKSPDRITNFISLVKKGDEQVWSGRGSLRYDFAYPDSAKEKRVTYNKEGTVQEYLVTSSKADVEFAFDRNRLLCAAANHGPLDPPREEYAYDGKKAYRYTEGVMADEKVHQKTGYIGKNAEFIPRDRFDPRFIGMTVLNEPIGAFLEKILTEEGPEGISLEGEEYVDSTLCQIVQATSRIENGRVYTLWLAPEYGCRMLKFDRRDSNEHVEARIHYRKIGDSGWFPREIVLDRKFGEKHVIHQTLAALDNWRINISLPDSLFRIRFPKGTRVDDRWTRRIYTVK